MRAFQIQDIKVFMSRLLLSSTFDRFLLHEASISTFSTFTIDGHLNKDYYSYDEEEKDTVDTIKYGYWEQYRPFCLSLIKGKKTPTGMKLVFQLSPGGLTKLLSSNHLNIHPEDVGGLFLNIRYDGQKLLATTGTSLKVFMVDKTLDQLWDNLITNFLKKHEIPFTTE